jgi:acetoin utilization protein AcuB
LVCTVWRYLHDTTNRILSTFERAPAGYRRVYLRFYDVPRERLDDLLELLRSKARMRYLVDHREDRRIIFETD